MTGAVQLSRGYTLIEMMAVMAILATVLGIGMLSVDSTLPSFQLDKEVSSLALALRDGRNRAVISGKIIRLEIYPDSHTMEYYYDEPEPSDDPLLPFEDPVPFHVVQWNDRVVIERALVGRDEAFTSGEAVVLRFWPSGLCTPVRLYLHHQKGTNDKRTVRLNPLTGQTRVVRGEEEPESYELTVTPEQR